MQHDDRDDALGDDHPEWARPEEKSLLTRWAICGIYAGIMMALAGALQWLMN